MVSYALINISRTCMRRLCLRIAAASLSIEAAEETSSLKGDPDAQGRGGVVVMVDVFVVVVVVGTLEGKV